MTSLHCTATKKKKDNCAIKLTALNYIKINEIENFLYRIFRKHLVLCEKIFKLGNRSFHIIGCVLHFFMTQKDPLYTPVINPGLSDKGQ